MKSRLKKNLVRLGICGFLLAIYYAEGRLFLCGDDVSDPCNLAIDISTLVLAGLVLVLTLTVRSNKQFVVSLVTLGVILGPLSHCGSYYFAQSQNSEVSRNFTLKIMKNLSRRLEEFKKTCGFYPRVEEGGLKVLVLGSDTCSHWRPRPNLKEALNDAYGTPFLYEVNAEDEAVIRSLGADGLIGGEGDDEDLVLTAPTVGSSVPE